MSTKAALNAAKAAAQANNWEETRKQASSVLAKDPGNYNANVFLALASSKQSQIPESEAAYLKAIETKREEVSAWQGLVSLYEASWQVDKYIDASMTLAGLYINKDERTRCQTVVDKILPFVVRQGNRTQMKRAYECLLPTSPIYDYLEGLIPLPATTYQKLAEIIEAEEKETISKEIATRKSRLGATAQGVKAEVQLEVYRKSPLEQIYDSIINWTHEDEVRRVYESKQIQRGYDLLLVLPPTQKEEQRMKVLKWCEGVVIIKSPFELAWKCWIEWRLYESIGDLDVSVLTEYVDIFPDSGLGRLLRGFFGCETSPFPAIETAKRDDDEGGVSLNTEIDADERLDYMINGLELSKGSILGHRIMGEYYLYLREYETAVDICRKGKRLILEEGRRSGIDFQVNTNAITITLATALIHYQTPKHHPEASTLFNAILEHTPTASGALIGLGLILEESGDFGAAATFLNQALSRDPDNIHVLSEAAWCEIMQGHYDIGRGQLEVCLGMITGTDPASLELRAQTLWRIGTALWEADPDAREEREGAFRYWMMALKNNGNYAPAFTSIGVFYADVAGDTERANKCFQKAFELSAGEFEAAERLARSFADSREWELVEIVARRAADAEKKRTTPGKGASWPMIALGVVELNAQNYMASIQAFQSALRIVPDDFHSWVGLGEAYVGSGRYTAATKAFGQAKLLDGTNWFAIYMLANVQQELGSYAEACSGYRAVLNTRPNEFGVLIALTETLVADAVASVENGLYGRAAESADEALHTAQRVVNSRPDAFNLWKAVGDACLVFTTIQSLTPQFPLDDVVKLLTTDIDVAEFDILSEMDTIGSDALKSVPSLSPVDAVLTCAVLAYKRGIYASTEDRHAHAVAWFNLGSAEFRAFVCSNSGEREEREGKYRLAAVRCFKRSIKLEPGNAEFWNAMGVAMGEVSPRIAQHALIRSLYIDEKNARTWANLGSLYLLQQDYDLANQAFGKAQSTDPEYAYSWVGQGLVALLIGELSDAQELFEHAWQIGGSISPIVKRSYATTTFDIISRSPTPTDLTVPIFALLKLTQQVDKGDVVPARLAALMNERLGAFSASIAALVGISATLEGRYETTESETSLRQYAEAQGDLARAYLGEKEYDLAVTHATTALDLSDGLDGMVRCRLSAHLTGGLGCWFEGRMEESLDMFRSALEESGGSDADIVCLLAEVLWAKGGEEERDVVREQLLESIEKHPDHLQSTLLLAVIGTLDGDVDIAESALEEVRAARGSNTLSVDQKGKVDKLLTSVAGLHGGATAAGTFAESIFLRPGHSSAWAALADADAVNDDREGRFAADMALSLAMKNAKEVGAEELSESFARIGRVEDDLVAVWLAPWKEAGWKRLSEDLLWR